MITVRTKAELREALAGRTGSVGLVPTMGALHEGHLALIRAARDECDLVVATSFVNPAQFGEQADLDAYPRDPEADARIAAGGGVDVLFVPALEQVYPPGFATWVEPGGAAIGLEGEFRPGHFRGVATICLKLFNLVRPERAYFGRKDAQQVAVVEAARPRPRPRARDPRGTDRPRRRRARDLVPERAPVRELTAAARWQSRGLSRRATPTGPAPPSPRPASSPSTWRSQTSTGPRSRSQSSSARPA